MNNPITVFKPSHMYMYDMYMLCIKVLRINTK